MTPYVVLGLLAVLFVVVVIKVVIALMAENGASRGSRLILAAIFDFAVAPFVVMLFGQEVFKFHIDYWQAFLVAALIGTLALRITSDDVERSAR